MDEVDTKTTAGVDDITCGNIELVVGDVEIMGGVTVVAADMPLIRYCVMK